MHPFIKLCDKPLLISLSLSQLSDDSILLESSCHLSRHLIFNTANYLVIVPLHLLNLPLATSNHCIIFHCLSQGLKWVVRSVTVLLHCASSCKLDIQWLFLTKRVLEVQLVLFKLCYFEIVVPHLSDEEVSLPFKVFSLFDIVVVVLFHLVKDYSFQLLQVCKEQFCRFGFVGFWVVVV